VFLAGGLVIVAAVILIDVGPLATDFGVYLTGARTLLDGGDLYGLRGFTYGFFTYPPFAALFFVPWVALPPLVAQVVWTGGVVACVWGMLQPYLPRATWTTVIVATVVPFTAVVINMAGFGQIGALLTVLVLLDVAALQRGARYAGIFTGLAAALKLTPAVFLLWMLAAGWWRAMLFPADSGRFWGTTLWETDRVGPLEWAGNQSLLGFSLRIGLERPAAFMVVAAATVLGIMAAAYTARRAGLWWGALHAGCLMVLITPLAWSHHYTWPLLAGVALAGVRHWVLGPLGVGVLVVLLRVPALFGPSWLAQNDMVLALIALVAALPLASLSPRHIRYLRRSERLTAARLGTLLTRQGLRPT
jgi:alpha-1,2-mannosyltransferase